MATADQYIKLAAADFGRHTRGGGGWALGLEVASCVKPGTGQGARLRNDRYKVSAQEFARQSGTSAPRVMRHYDAWELAAAEGLVPHAEDLAPEDWDNDGNIPKKTDWTEFYDSMRQATPTARRAALEKAAAEAGVSRTKVIDIATNPSAVAVAIAADPALAAAIAANVDAGDAVSREVNKRHHLEGDDLRQQKIRLRQRQMEQDMEDGIDPDDNAATRLEGAAADLGFAFQLGGVATTLKDMVKRLKRNGCSLTERDEVRLHVPKIRAALDDLEVLVETGDMDDEAEQLLGGNT